MLKEIYQEGKKRKENAKVLNMGILKVGEEKEIFTEEDNETHNCLKRA